MFVFFLTVGFVIFGVISQSILRTQLLRSKKFFITLDYYLQQDLEMTAMDPLHVLLSRLLIVWVVNAPVLTGLCQCQMVHPVSAL